MVIDCPRSDPSVIDALDIASTVVIVANQELPTLRSASRLAAMLRQRCGAQRVKLAISRFDAESEIGRKDVERVLGGTINFTFPSDYRAAVGALNKGEPLVSAMAGKLAVSFDDAARELAGLPATSRDTVKTGLFGRMAAGVDDWSSDDMALTDRARVVPGGMVDVRQAHYQDSKERIHRALLNRLNLDRLNRVGRTQAEPEIRSLIMTLLDSESSNVPLSMSEREALITDVFNELFGLGPARGAARRPDGLGHPRQPLRPDLRRARRPARTEPARLQGRPAPAAHHRADRQLGRPPHRRIEPDGGRPPRRRLARQRGHPAAGARRPGAVDPPLPHRPPRARATWSSGSR